MRRRLEWYAWDLLITVFWFGLAYWFFMLFGHSKGLWPYYEHVGSLVRSFVEQNDTVIGYAVIGVGWMVCISLWVSFRAVEKAIEHMRFEYIEDGPFTKMYGKLRKFRQTMRVADEEEGVL